jgi:hypothetical protein
LNTVLIDTRAAAATSATVTASKPRSRNKPVAMSLSAVRVAAFFSSLSPTKESYISTKVGVTPSMVVA